MTLSLLDDEKRDLLAVIDKYQVQSVLQRHAHTRPCLTCLPLIPTHTLSSPLCVASLCTQSRAAARLAVVPKERATVASAIRRHYADLLDQQRQASAARLKVHLGHTQTACSCTAYLKQHRTHAAQAMEEKANTEAAAQARRLARKASREFEDVVWPALLQLETSTRAQVRTLSLTPCGAALTLQPLLLCCCAAYRGPAVAPGGPQVCRHAGRGPER